MRTRAALLGATALVATSWFTTQYDTFPRVSGYTLQTSGTVYRRLGEFDRLDFITASTVVFLTTTGSNTWTQPGDCPATVDSVEVIGAGYNGAAGATPRTAVGGAGGGGGAYSKVTSLAVGSSESYTVGAGNNSGGTSNDTWFKSTSDVLAKGALGQNGGAAASGVGSTKNNGGTGGSGNQSTGGGGGGGAGGAAGAGNNATSIWDGGSGDAGSGGSSGPGGTPPTAGGNGSEWTATAGGTAGSGGGGGGRKTTVGAGADGGLYGGGGGGGFASGGAGGVAKQGIVVITYTPTGGDTLFAQICL